MSADERRPYRFGHFTRSAVNSSAAEPVRQMFTMAPPDRGWVPALRIALTTALPLGLLLVTGNSEYTIFASFGAFTSIFGKNTPQKNRLFDQCCAAFMIIMCTMLGLNMTLTHISHWIVIPVSALVAAVCAMVVQYFGIRPPGSLFFIFASGAIGILPFQGNAYFAMAVLLGSAAWAILLGSFWHVFGEGKNRSAAPASSRSTVGLVRYLEQGAVYFVAGVLSGYIGSLLGSPHSYWAMVAASSALAMPSMVDRYRRALERVSGTFIGVFTSAFFISMNPSHFHLVVMIVAAQFIGQSFIKRNYAFSMFFITPQALFMIYMVHPFTTTEVLTDRLLETAIGAVVGVLAVFLTRSPEKVDMNTLAVPALRVARRLKK